MIRKIPLDHLYPMFPMNQTNRMNQMFQKNLKILLFQIPLR